MTCGGPWCIGGCGSAARIVKTARARDIPVVSANKMLLALDGDLRSQVGRQGRVAGSASVGGSVPALETVVDLARREPVVAVEGIINGTCNFILDLVNGGLSPEEALARAQAQGFAEDEIPPDLQPKARPAHYDGLVKELEEGGRNAPALNVHNEVGFAPAARFSAAIANAIRHCSKSTR